MTYNEAMEVRLRHAQRQPVEPEQLELANRVVMATRALVAEHGIPEPEPVKAEAPPKPAFPVKQILVHPAEPLPADFPVISSRVPLPCVKVATPPNPPEPSDKPRAGRWKQVDTLVLAHDRTSVSLGHLHKVTVQVRDFYP